MDLWDPQPHLWGAPQISWTPKSPCGAAHGPPGPPTCVGQPTELENLHHLPQRSPLEGPQGPPTALVGRPTDLPDPQVPVWGSPWTCRTLHVTYGATHGLSGTPNPTCGAPHGPPSPHVGHPMDLSDPQPRLWGTNRAPGLSELLVGQPMDLLRPPSPHVGHPADLRDPQPHLWGTPRTSRTLQITYGAPHGPLGPPPFTYGAPHGPL